LEDAWWQNAAQKRGNSRGAQPEVASEMRRYKRASARSGRDGRAGKVKSRQQVIAIDLSNARRKGRKVPVRRRG